MTGMVTAHQTHGALLTLLFVLTLLKCLSKNNKHAFIMVIHLNSTLNEVLYVRTLVARLIPCLIFFYFYS